MHHWDHFIRKSSRSSSSGSSSPKSPSAYTSSPATSYSLHDDQPPSPLPSPREPTTSKTSAFFNTSFSSTSTPTPIPPPPPSRMTVPDGTSSRSADFFSKPKDATVLTPPPPLRSAPRSREDSPPRLPPLSRFFPHRYTMSDDSKREEKAQSWETDLKRELLRHLVGDGGKPDTDWMMKELPKNPQPLSPSSSASSLESSPPASLRNLPTRANSRKKRATVLQRPSHSSLSEEYHIPEIPIVEEELRPGAVIGGTDVRLTLIHELGEGAFSRVWLAQDIFGTLDSLGKKPVSESWAKKREDSSWTEGLKPSVSSLSMRSDRTEGSIVLDELAGDGASTVDSNGHVCIFPTSSSFPSSSRSEGRLVAVKMVARALCETNDQTRISFVREVEVLRHISHPSIVAYLHSFTTPSYHCLVLENIEGGELFDLINSDEQYSRLTESSLRRMWGELCKAVGWMHGVALVHRDIKLENILLTRNIFAQSPQSNQTHLVLDDGPLIKLTDFGLSRFIDPNSPTLTTRCGSEAYAAPELIMSTDGYDGRETDAWACGVVLFAMATRHLPFEQQPSPRAHPDTGSTNPYSPDYGAEAKRRRDMLHRIIHCHYSWPEQDEQCALATDGLKKVVSRLLVRSTAKRAKLIDLWDEEWMRGDGAPLPPASTLRRRQSGRVSRRTGESTPALEAVDMDLTPSRAESENGHEFFDEDDFDIDWEDESEYEDDGVLVDMHSIHDIAMQELQAS